MSPISSDSQENIIHAVTSVYETRAVREILSDAETLNKCKRSDLPPILRGASEAHACTVKMNNIPLKKITFDSIFLQNAHVLGRRYEYVWRLRKKNLRYNHLQPKHRIVILLASVNHWWHEPSKELMREFINSKLVNDLKSLSTKDVLIKAVDKFNISDAGHC
ncbi:hypothetical protein EVAR_76941_1 [Eumeta japonica]|uniref:Uncharacterized protein n=1 Tax=Eumeta variegata TaxID=151549 RepID=A0A4C1SF13_EUMVA|nr:hypothetical protein EVAR_76941_1 [Eumeta japonica]